MLQFGNYLMATLQHNIIHNVITIESKIVHDMNFLLKKST